MRPLSAGSDGRSWTGPRPFVGRDTVIAELLNETDAALADGGRAVFLLGEPGSGKTALLGVLEELAHRRHGELQTGYALCDPEGGVQSAWQRLDEQFTYSTRMRRAALSLVPDWMQVVPLVGPIAAAAMITIQRVRGGSAPRRRQRGRDREPSVLDSVRSLLEYGKGQPCLVLLDHLERATPDDLAGVSALIRRLADSRILFVAAARTVNGRPAGTVRELLLEAERQGRTRQVELAGFDRDELMEVVSLIVQGMIPSQWLEWLATETRGCPGPLWDRLGALEHAGQLQKRRRTWALEGEPPQPDLTEAEAMNAVIGLVDDGTRRLLGLAAMEGDTFHSAVVAELAGMPELEVEDRLAPLVRSGLLSYLGEHDLGLELTSRYAFSTAQDARAFAATLPVGERPTLATRAREVRGSLGVAPSG